MPSNSLPRVVFLNRCYWPDSEATGQLLNDLCLSLRHDYEVHVVCGLPNSPVSDDYVRCGHQYKDGIHIHRIAHTRFSKRIPAGRLLNLLSFTASAWWYLRRSRLPASVLVSETDPFLLPLVGASHSKRIGCRFISYLQDIYPDVAEAIGKARPSLFTRSIRKRLQAAYHTADKVVVLGQCMKDRLTSMPWGITPSNKLTVIPNWADCESVRPQPKTGNSFRREHCLDDKFVIMHSGNMGLTQQLDHLVWATQSEHWPQNGVLVLVGDGAAKRLLQQQVAKLGTDRVRFLPYQPRQTLASSLGAADLHVVSMHPKITGCLCPSKLYGILAAGRPVLAIADSGTDLCRVVENEKLGWTCRPGQVDQIALAVGDAARKTETLEQMGNRARQMAVENFDRQVVTSRFIDLLDQVVQARPAA